MPSMPARVCLSSGSTSSRKHRFSAPSSNLYKQNMGVALANGRFWSDQALGNCHYRMDRAADVLRSCSGERGLSVVDAPWYAYA